jgi:hypothetical protein
VILFGKGITAQRDECLVEELYKLAILIGAVDGERAGLLSLKGEANSLAATLLGLDQVFELNGQKAVYVAVGDDYVSRSLVERVSKAPYLVVQASFESNSLRKPMSFSCHGLVGAGRSLYQLDGRLQNGKGSCST